MIITDNKNTNQLKVSKYRKIFEMLSEDYEFALMIREKDSGSELATVYHLPDPKTGKLSWTKLSELCGCFCAFIGNLTTYHWRMRASFQDIDFYDSEKMKQQQVENN